MTSSCVSTVTSIFIKNNLFSLSIDLSINVISLILFYVGNFQEIFLRLVKEFELSLCLLLRAKYLKFGNILLGWYLASDPSQSCAHFYPDDERKHGLEAVRPPSFTIFIVRSIDFSPPSQ